jgi:protein-tyrosine phosphatase
MAQHIAVEGSYNVRDLGGHPTGDGRVTQSRVLIRAGNLDKVSPAAQQQLLDYGVKTVIDLRDESEIEAAPNVFAQSTAVRYLSLPLIGNVLSSNPAWQAEVNSISTLGELYGTYLEGCQLQIGAIVTAIAASEAATVYHCYAGKDRTGVVSALLLSAMGVPDSAIVEDYAHSRDQIAHLVVQWRVNAVYYGEDLKRLERDAGADPETMATTLKHLQQRYGGAIQYLHQCGVAASQLERLRTHFISDALA